MPACLGLLPLWAGFYRRRGSWRFARASALAVVVDLRGARPGSSPTSPTGPGPWGRGRLAEAGLLPASRPRRPAASGRGSTPSYRLPVLIAYLALVVVTTFWPAEKNLGELIALSAALLVASQFWYLDAGGTLVLLYLPLVILMMFRPNLSTQEARSRDRPDALGSASRPSRRGEATTRVPRENRGDQIRTGDLLLPRQAR